MNDFFVIFCLSFVLLSLQSKTLPQVSGEPIWHKNKKVSENSET